MVGFYGKLVGKYTVPRSMDGFVKVLEVRGSFNSHGFFQTHLRLIRLQLGNSS